MQSIVYYQMPDNTRRLIRYMRNILNNSIPRFDSRITNDFFVSSIRKKFPSITQEQATNFVRGVKAGTMGQNMIYASNTFPTEIAETLAHYYDTLGTANGIHRDVIADYYVTERGSPDEKSFASEAIDKKAKNRFDIKVVNAKVDPAVLANQPNETDFIFSKRAKTLKNTRQDKAEETVRKAEDQQQKEFEALARQEQLKAGNEDEDQYFEQPDPLPASYK